MKTRTIMPVKQLSNYYFVCLANDHGGGKIPPWEEDGGLYGVMVCSVS
jgi:hypothetical protein